MNEAIRRGVPCPLAGIGLFLAAMTLVGDLGAQPAQAMSVQASALYGGGPQGAGSGPGWEVQLRLQPTSFSIGAGAEHTFHEITTANGREVQLLGGFLEPRWALVVARGAELYLSARLTLSQVKLKEGAFRSSGTGYTLGGGGGLRLRLWGRLSLDAGALAGYSDVGVVEAPGGPLDLSTTTRLVGRVGLAVGVG